MTKLNRRELFWIIRSLNRGLSVYAIAKEMKVSRRWIRNIIEIYEKTGNVPVFKKKGRKIQFLSEEDEKLIVETWKSNPLNALNLETYFRVSMNKKISHNKIHQILKRAGLAANEPKKQQKRKWVRYERKHSNSLWHVDWSRLDDGKQLIIYEDDASRFITGFGVFDHATLTHSLEVFIKATKEYGAPKQLLSDNGTQFRFNEAFDRDLETKNKFQKFMEKEGVRQIFTRVHRPQANGKVERLFYSIKKYIRHFGTVEKAIEYYNFRRPHMSLRMEELETPAQAFKRKATKKRM